MVDVQLDHVLTCLVNIGVAHYVVASKADGFFARLIRRPDCLLPVARTLAPIHVDLHLHVLPGREAFMREEHMDLPRIGTERERLLVAARIASSRDSKS